MSSSPDSADRKALLRQALRTVEDLQARLDRSEKARREPIAVVGLGCRYPGAGDPEALWDLLREGVDAVREVPVDRWDPDALDVGDAGERGRVAARLGGFLERVDLFDPKFFGISPREAATLDPQQRLLLEVAWEALENAGQAPDRLRGSRTGVFVGITTSDYAKIVGVGEGRQTDVYAATGNALNAAAGRISFVLGLQGPCVAVDTACSSSLTATHLACQSLRAGDCDLALAGGVNVVLSPNAALLFARWGMLAADGRCKTFDAAADGFVRSEGCGVLALKRLSRAEADGDRILALLAGSAVNQDGASSGLTVPNGPAQQAVLRQALEVAGVEPGEVDYVEAHGTGTPIGDPIEVEALAAVMVRGQDREHPLSIGSIKTNIGHAEAASGLAGLLKVVLSLQHQEIPPHLHVRELNPRFDWGDALKVPTRLTPWLRGERRRIAGVSSFGFSGTNAHVVVTEPPLAVAPAATAPERPLHVLTLSARTDEALRDEARRLEQRLAGDASLELPDVAFTLNAGRASFAHRAAVVARDGDEARGRLAALGAGREVPGVREGSVGRGERPRIAFLFTGQGSQYGGMGRELYETQPLFRAELDRCEEIARREAGFSLLEVMFEEESSRIDRTEFTQPALFAIEWGLAQMWRAWGVEPSCVLGHSIGEFTAACVAGVMAFEDALRLVLARGRLMGSLPEGGTMISCLASEERIRVAIQDGSHEVSIAGINGPESVALSGRREAVEKAAVALEGAGIKTKPLTVSHAFHSALMEPILGKLEDEAARIEYRAPKLPVMSNLTGRALEEGEISARYWAKHAREAVRFQQGMKSLEEHGCTVFLEIGPRPVLLGMGQGCVTDGHGTWWPTLRKGRADWEQVLESMGGLYCGGVAVDWRSFDRNHRRQKLALPTYPFQRERHWVEPTLDRRREVAASGSTGDPGHALLGHRLRSASAGRQFESTLGNGRTAYLLDHALYGQPVFPGAGYFEIALATAGESPVELQDVTIEQPMPLIEGEPRIVQCLVDEEGGFQVFGLAGDAPGSWRRHAAGRVVSLAEESGETLVLEEAETRCPRELDTSAFYGQFRAVGVEYGPSFRVIESLRSGEGEALGRLRLPASAGRAEGYRLHPALLDGAFQTLGALILDRGLEGDLFVPTGVSRLRAWGSLGSTAWAQARLTSHSSDGFTAELRLFDEAGSPTASVEGLALRRITREALARLLPQPHVDWIYETTWEEKPLAASASAPLPTWIVMTDGGDLGSEIAERLRSRGAQVQTIGADNPEALEARIDDRREIRGVVYLGALGHSESDGLQTLSTQEQSLGGALRAAQALVRTEAPARLYLVTRGAHSVGDGPAEAPSQRSLWGLGATLAMEHPELGCVRVDLDPTADGADALVQELSAVDGEEEVAYRGSTRYAARLARPAGAGAAVPGEALHLRVEKRGSLDGLALASRPRRAPGAGEVEIRVEACGLNFRDVLGVLGMYPGPPLPLGTECAGRVISVGEGVSGLTPGDDVLAMVSGAFATHVTARSDFVVRRPTGMSAEDAATIPSAFLTADYALRRIGRLRRGERVLIHAAAGGVGMAAVQLAKRVGAEIFATAGSPEKRAFLESLGVPHVLKSRDLTFASEVRRRTDGEGVDLVLNALAGEFVPASLALLRPGGRFLEIGKRGIWDAEKVAAEYPGIEYHVCDLGEVAERDPRLIREMLEATLSAVGDGELDPLPITSFWLSDPSTAFRFMAKAKHIGKIVLRTAALGGLEARPEATYLVTGGLGGLGLVIARWLAEQGATRLVLAGRRPPSEDARKAVQEIEELGATVEVRQADVSRAEGVRALLDGLSGLPPLRGVVHAAGVVADGAFANQTWERFEEVLAPKARGAWALHEGTQDADLDFFVLFSSASAVLGSPGQANYAAANSLLDGLAHYRRAHGLTALSVNWGAWADVGMAAQLGARDAAYQSDRGLGRIPPRAGAEALGDLIARDVTQATVLPVVWSTFLEALAGVGRSPRYERMVVESARGDQGDEAGRKEAGPDEESEDLRRSLATASPVERKTLVGQHVRSLVARVLGIAPGTPLEDEDALTTLGLDSLMAVEIRNGMKTRLGVLLPMATLLESPSVARLTSAVLETLAETPLPAEGSPPEDRALDPERAESLLGQIDDMSDQDVEKLLGDLAKEGPTG